MQQIYRLIDGETLCIFKSFFCLFLFLLLPVSCLLLPASCFLPLGAEEAAAGQEGGGDGGGAQQEQSRSHEAAGADAWRRSRRRNSGEEEHGSWFHFKMQRLLLRLRIYGTSQTHPEIFKPRHHLQQEDEIKYVNLFLCWNRASSPPS